jgi:uncharacterized protein
MNYDWILKNKWKLIFIIAVITLVLAPFAAQVRPNNSIESLGVINDPDLTLLKKLEAVFGNDEFVSISFKHDDILSSDALQIIASLTHEIESVRGVDKVISLTNLQDLTSDTKSEEIKIAKLVQDSWIKTGVPKNSQRDILENKAYQRMLFNQDGKSTSIYAQFKSMGTDNVARDAALEKTSFILSEKSLQTGIKFHLMGMPVVDRMIFKTVENEQYYTTGVIVLLVMLTFMALYRRWLFILIPLGLMGLITVWVLGLVKITGSHYSWILALAPAIVLVVSICDAVHLINGYLENKHLDRKARFIKVMKDAGMPCLLTSLTTAFGFFAIATSRILPLRDFGIFAGIGTLLTFLLSIILIPMVFDVIDLNSHAKKSHRYASFVRRLLRKIHSVNLRHGTIVLFVSMAIIILSIVGVFRINVDTHPLSMFKWGAEDLNAGSEFIQKHTGIGTEFYGYMEAAEEGFFLRPDILKKLDKIKMRMVAEVGPIVKVITLADLVKRANQVIHNGDEKYYTIPNTKEKVSQLLFLYSLSAEEDVVNLLAIDEFSKGRIRIFTVLTDSARIIVDSIQKSLDIGTEILPNDVAFLITGQPAIKNNTLFHVVESQVVGIAIALLIICSVISLLFKSIKQGLFSLIPNVIPMLFCLGFMGWAGISLGVATAIVTCLILGIAVDDTIHIMWHVKKRVEAGDSYETAVEHTFKNIGRAIMTTTIILSVGFLGTMISKMWPTSYFGLMTALGCVVALVSDLFLLPVLLMKIKPFTNLT